MLQVTEVLHFSDIFINKPSSQSLFHHNHTAWLDQVNDSGEAA